MDGQPNYERRSDSTPIRTRRPALVRLFPDGETLAFINVEGSLSKVDLTDGVIETLTGYDDPDQTLAVGPDGDRIVIVTDRFSRGSLAVVAADGSGIEALADDNYLYDDPQWGDEDIIYATRSRHRDLFDY